MLCPPIMAPLAKPVPEEELEMLSGGGVQFAVDAEGNVAGDFLMEESDFTAQEYG